VLTIRGERIQPIDRLPRLSIDAVFERFTYGPSQSSTGRIMANVVLIQGMRVSVAAERGTFTGLAHDGTVFSLRVERTTGLPFAERTSSSGSVFVDRNGNGRRDPDEPGFPGAVVRRGSETVVTDAQGDFRFTTTSRAALNLDARSLPAGWVRGPSGGLDDLNISVIPVGSVVVQPVLAATALRDNDVRLGLVTVILTDSTGQSWVARATDGRSATFDALPAGSYRIDVDVSRASEPLLVDPIAPIHVSVGGGTIRIIATVRPRPVRVQRFAPARAPTVP
jgi:hypothetical protein